MSRRGAEGSLFVGRLSKTTRTRDLEELFEPYGRLLRCDIKYGYAFVDFEDRRDAEDAIRYENGRDVCGSSIIVEWAKGNPRRPMDDDYRGGGGGGGSSRGYMARLVSSHQSKGYDECYKCHRVGHWARDCPEDRDRYYGYRRPRASYGRDNRRRRSRSRDRRRRSRSRSKDRRKKSYSRSASRSRSPERKRARSNSKSRSRSRSRTPERSPSKSPARSRSPEADQNGDGGGGGSRSPSPARSRSRSRSQSK